MNEDRLIQNTYDSSESSSEIEVVVDNDKKGNNGVIDGQSGKNSIFEFDISALEDKPWNRPGADITDYFNYGFNEKTWKEYCNMQKNKNPFKFRGDGKRYGQYKKDDKNEGNKKSGKEGNYDNLNKKNYR